MLHVIVLFFIPTYTKNMAAFLFLPFEFFRFWFIDSPRELILYFHSLNIAFLHQFSMPLMIATFFKPLKNEYREGLVWFSIGMGMFVKFWLIIVDLFLLFILMIVEIAIILAFISWPILATSVLFFDLHL